MNKIIINAKTEEIKTEKVEYVEDNEKAKPTLEERLNAVEETELERLMS